MSLAPNEKEIFLERLTRITEANFTNAQFGVSELAREMGMSRSNLHRRLKPVTGLSISKFICSVRLKRANELLKESSTPISGIAFETGFHSVTYFTKCFHDYFGYPPGEARTLVHEDNPEPLLRSKTVGWLWGKRVSPIYFISLTLLFILFIILYVFIKPFSSRTPPLDKSIAVLPFFNDSPDQERMYFINGTMEAIMDNLCKIEDLRVVSRNSVEHYRHNPKPTPEVAKEMNVSYILEGSGHRDGDDVRIIIQLLNGRKDQHLWSKTYETHIDEIFSVQSEIAQLVAKEIEAAITPEEKRLIERIPTSNHVAYELYLQAREETHYWADREVLERAINLLRSSIASDSTFADPYAHLGWIYGVFYLRNPLDFPGYLDSVLVYADKALSLDDQQDLAYEIKGGYYTNKGNFKRAAEQYNHAINVNPNSYTAYFGKGWLYFRQNDFIPSIESFYKVTLLNRGQHLAPALQNMGYAYNQAGFPEKYMELLYEIVELDGDSLFFFKEYAYSKGTAGNYSEALEAAQKAFAYDTSDLKTLDILMMVHFKLGQENEALRYCKLYLDRMEALNQYVPYNMTTVIGILMHSGNIEQANFYLAKLIEFDQNALNSNPLDRLMRSVSINALKKETENIYNELSRITQLEKLNIWVLTLRTNPELKEISGEPEFLRLVGEIEKKYQAQRERDRKWLVENDMLINHTVDNSSPE